MSLFKMMNIYLLKTYCNDKKESGRTSMKNHIWQIKNEKN